VLHKAHLLTNNIAKLKNNQQPSITSWQQGAHWRIFDLAPEKGDEANKQAPSKPTQRNPNSKAGWLVGYRADLQNLRTSHTSLREELTKQLLLNDRKKNLASLYNHLARLRQSFCLSTNTRTACWRCNTRTTKTEILLFLNIEFFLSVCLCVLFPVCLPTISC
jgi:hypothetical protein